MEGRTPCHPLPIGEKGSGAKNNEQRIAQRASQCLSARF